MGFGHSSRLHTAQKYCVFPKICATAADKQPAQPDKFNTTSIDKRAGIKLSVERP
jgi:hypothetical protein